MSNLTRLRICRVVTVPTTFDTLLRRQILTIHENHDLTLVCNFEGSDTRPELERKGIKTFSLGIGRDVTPFRDVLAVFSLAMFLRRNRFDIVHTTTPKAGIVGMLSAWFSRTPRRIHTYTGQIWMNLRGVKRWIFLGIDKVIATLATEIYADSSSQRELLSAHGVADSVAINVIGLGSISGVDLERFNSTAYPESFRRNMRSEMQIPNSAVVLVFVGRVGPEKGIVELIDSFLSLRKDSDIFLLIVGPMELARQQFPRETLEKIENCSEIVCTGYEKHPEKYLAISDIFCLPSYREGFGSVVIEAGAMGLPVVGTRISGLVDAVADDETGVLVEARNTEQLTEALRRLIKNKELRKRMGEAGKKRAHEHFSSEKIDKAVSDAYLHGASWTVADG